MSSLEVIEDFIGERLNYATREVLIKAPDEQFIELTYQLCEQWDRALTQRIAVPPNEDTPYYIPEQGRKADVLPAGTYKKLALYFSDVAMPDPIEVAIAPPVALWRATNEVHPSSLKKLFLEGLETLVKIAPLVRCGALVLVPSVDLGLHNEVQAVARGTYAALTTKPEKGSLEEYELSQLIGSTAVCAAAAYSPVFGSSRMWRRINSSAQVLTPSSLGPDAVMRHAVAQFELPRAADIPIEKLVEVRANVEAFDRFRKTIGMATLQARRVAESDGIEYAQSCFEMLIAPEVERCVAAASSGISARDGVFIPGATALGVGIACSLAGVKDLTVPANIAELALNVAAPPATWMLYKLHTRLRRRGGNVDATAAAAAVYASLLDM